MSFFPLSRTNEHTNSHFSPCACQPPPPLLYGTSCERMRPVRVSEFMACVLSPRCVCTPLHFAHTSLQNLWTERERASRGRGGTRVRLTEDKLASFADYMQPGNLRTTLIILCILNSPLEHVLCKNLRHAQLVFTHTLSGVKGWCVSH